MTEPKKKPGRPKKPAKEPVPRPLTEVEKFYVQGHCDALTGEELAAKLDRPVADITPAAQEYLLAKRRAAHLARVGGVEGSAVYTPAAALSDEAVAHLTRATDPDYIDQFRVK